MEICSSLKIFKTLNSQFPFGSSIGFWFKQSIQCSHFWGSERNLSEEKILVNILKYYCSSLGKQLCCEEIPIEVFKGENILLASLIFLLEHP